MTKRNYPFPRASMTPEWPCFEVRRNRAARLGLFLYRHQNLFFAVAIVLAFGFVLSVLIGLPPLASMD